MQGNDVLDKMAAEFDRLSATLLLPAYMATGDKTRARINDAVSEMLDSRTNTGFSWKK